MTRVETSPEDISAERAYKLLTALVLPRPIAWVSTTSAAGVDNVAPHSFSTVVSSTPPMVLFTTIGWSDSSRNARDTGEFVVHLTPERLITEVNRTAIRYPPEVDEFQAVGLTKEPSVRVRPPRVREAPALWECRVVELVEHGNGVMVIGEVVHFAVDEDCFEDGRPSPRLLDPVSRLGGPLWASLGEIHVVPRLRLDTDRS